MRRRRYLVIVFTQFSKIPGGGGGEGLYKEQSYYSDALISPLSL